MPKRIAPLTDTQLRSIKPAAKDIKLFDGGGLFLLVTTAGGKLWRFKYRFGGREKLLTFGAYPQISLADARQKRDKARELVAQGIDPGAAKKEQEGVGNNTFAKLAAEWMEYKKASRFSVRHAERVWRSLENDIFPSLGHLPVAEISTKQIAEVIKQIESRGVRETAARALQKITAILQFAAKDERVSHNAARELRGTVETRRVEHMPAMTREDLPEFLRRLEVANVYAVTRLAIKMVLLTLTRTQEIRGAQWEEFDLDGRLWTIPASRMKMKMEHRVPLSVQALEVLEQLRPFSGREKLCFPGHHDPSRMMSENAMLYALWRMGYRGKATVHGFRATGSTILNERGFNPDAIERQLAHAERNKIRAAYHRSEYMEERRKMMDWWANYLDQLKEEGN
ncbi:MAG: DUF4102 domain-containing protein [Desulfurivibrio sp.]|nr:DUF4102 domain-containing protein [Desulfurivibrio sp.]MBU4118283.1 integrase arm-type DNA-binding domain-containing protein [Pseudomonadota bacterium]